MLLALAFSPLGASLCYGQDADNDPLAILRQSALDSIKQIKNFICFQTMTRSGDDTGTGKHWKSLEVQELELAYSANQAHYTLRSVNGKTTRMESRIKRGYPNVAGGVEFNAILNLIFAPEAKAEIVQDRAASAGTNACVFRYSVPRATSTMIYQTEYEKIVEAHHGSVVANCETGEIHEIQFETDPILIDTAIARPFGTAKLKTAASSKWDILYSRVQIGGKEFVVPQSSTVVQRLGDILTKSESRFHDYRKFQADVRILADSDPIDR